MAEVENVPNLAKPAIHGIVDGAGNIVAGSGFSVGLIVADFPTFRVTFDTPFSAQPIITATCITPPNNIVKSDIATILLQGSFTIQMKHSGHDGFSFIAIGLW